MTGSDATVEALQDIGYDGALPDMLKQYLGDLGYDDSMSLTDRMARWDGVVRPLSAYASLSLDFINGLYEAKDKDTNLVDRSGFSNIVTFTRASSGGRFNSSGLYETVAANIPRSDYDPVTLQPKGLLIEEARTNLLTYSEDFGNAAWAKNAASVAGDSITSPDGLVTADKLVEDTASGGHHTQRTVTVTSGTTYTFGCFVKAGERTFCELLMAQSTTPFTNHALVRFNLATGAVSTVSVAGAGYGIKPAGNGWYFVWVSGTATSTAEICRISLSQSGTSSYTGDGTSGIYIWGAQLEAGAFPTSYIPTPATFTSRASTATYFNSSGVLQTAANNVARYDHRFIDGQWKPTGLFLENAATNLLTYSEQFDNATWIKANGTISANSALAPDGTMSAGKLVEHTGTTFSRVEKTISKEAAAIQYTATYFVKAAGRTQAKVGMQDGANGAVAYFNLSNGQVISTGGTGVSPFTGISASISLVNNGYSRLVLTATSSTATSIRSHIDPAVSGTNVYTGDGTSGIYIWGAQLEAGTLPTSYIPTEVSQVTRAADVSTSSQVTRSADVASVNTLSPWYNASEGTLYFEGASFGLGSGAASYAAALTDNSINEVITIRRNATGFGGAVVDNGAAQAAFAPTYSGGAITKIAFAFKANDFAMSKDGAAALTDTSGSLPTVDRLNIGSTAILSLHLNGHIRNISYYPAKHSNEALVGETK